MEPELIWAAGWVFLLGTLIASRCMKLGAALVIAFFKVLVSCVYFMMDPSGHWGILDDQTYFHSAKVMEAAGYSPGSILVDPQGILFMKYLAGGDGVVYYWWNFFVMRLLGFEYYSAVLVNVGSTFVSGYFFYKILIDSGKSQRYASWATAFFLVHWDILVWSSFLNIKDSLVLMLTLVCWSRVLRLFRRFSIPDFVGVLLCLFVMAFLRFYLPGLIVISIAISTFSRLKGPKKVVIGSLSGLGIVLFIATQIRHVGPYFHPTGIPLGIIRFWLTPQPWSIDPSHEFLLIPSIFHWLLLVPSLWVVGRLWREFPVSRILLTYVLILVVFYSAIPEVQGPRHRFQIVFALVWMQFEFLAGTVRHFQGARFAPRWARGVGRGI